MMIFLLKTDDLSDSVPVDDSLPVDDRADDLDFFDLCFFLRTDSEEYELVFSVSYTVATWAMDTSAGIYSTVIFPVQSAISA